MEYCFKSRIQKKENLRSNMKETGAKDGSLVAKEDSPKPSF